MPKLDDPSPQLDTRDLGNGQVLLRVNQQIDWKTALKVLELLRSETPQT
jgi:hypothetical protein